ncbi:GNAT family N-acetyltransferase [Nocardioides sp. zg-ZUI104]|uniref:GNAT family N-acetyltransferase n=1 Tax=Nocardioides faecalis TaxID=2803858 RepID=UPI001BD1AA47|nr:GNAT family N-acetyltransferase [Nocardioides faecalis]MBS4754401.1 GNAT family N-acetyltransferase [Nocardioides faecalis]
MSRYSLTTRVATRDDAPVLASLWTDSVRRADPSEQVADIEQIVKNGAASVEQRVMVVEYDGQVAGAVLLRIMSLSPLNLEPCVHAFYPRVFVDFRRHGVGHALMEAAASYAEENGILHVATAIPYGSREANRFMARLGLAPVATYRVAPTGVLRSRLVPQRGKTALDGRSKVLAARRSLRRARAERLATEE